MTALELFSPPEPPSMRGQPFLAGLLATWAAIHARGPEAKPNAQEKRAADFAARVALSELDRGLRP